MLLNSDVPVQGVQKISIVIAKFWRENSGGDFYKIFVTKNY